MFDVTNWVLKLFVGFWYNKELQRSTIWHQLLCTCWNYALKKCSLDVALFIVLQLTIVGCKPLYKVKDAKDTENAWQINKKKL